MLLQLLRFVPYQVPECSLHIPRPYRVTAMITVTAAIIHNNDTILIARKRAGLHLAGYWEFPGGKLEENETPGECLKRELMEEFSIHCRVGEYIGESIYDYGTKKIRLLGYTVHHLKGDFILRDHDMIRWLPVGDIDDIHRLVESITTLSWAPADIPLVQEFAARRFHEETIAYYNTSAVNYIEGTLANDMQQLRQAFTDLLPEGGHILDLGCGSGRDSKAFLSEGFEVTAMDASPAIAYHASHHINQKVLVKKAQDIEVADTYNGIWACASLLHLPDWELAPVLKRLERALLPDGVLYLSFKKQKYPDNSQIFFCYPNPADLRDLIKNCQRLQLVDSFTSCSSKTKSLHEQWHNIIARKTD